MSVSLKWPTQKSVAKRLVEIYAEAMMVPESKGEG